MPNKVEWFTVLGSFDNSNEAYAEHVEASDAWQAMAKVGKTAPGDLVLIGAIQGKHLLVTPGDDNKVVCYADEMADLLVEEVAE